MTEYELLDLVGTWKADTVANGTSFVLSGLPRQYKMEQ